jgi:5-(carboxyamino)imidazole ribonucleotide mutase
MPNGIPVATVALNAAKNAGILAAKIIALSDDRINEMIYYFQKELFEESMGKVRKLKEAGHPNFFDK